MLRDIRNIWCIVAQDYQTNEIRQFYGETLQDAVAYLTGFDRLVAHNGIMYDAPVVERLLRCKLPPIIDTVVCSRLLYPDRKQHPFGGNSLEAWGKFLGEHKGDHSDWSRFSEEMLVYCTKDVKVNRKIFDWMREQGVFKKYSKALQIEHDVAVIVQKQIENGVYVDPVAIQHLQQIVTEKHSELTDELRKRVPPTIEVRQYKKPAYYVDPTTQIKYAKKGDAPAKLRKHLIDGPPRVERIEHPFNPGSNDQISKFLMEKYHWKPKVFTDTGKPKVDRKTLEGLNYPEAKLLVQYSIIQKRLSQCKEWLDAMVEVGRSQGSPIYKLFGDVTTLGCVTGRMSHSKPNLAQIPKVSNPLGKECRSCFIPRPGWVQVGADASGLELRMLAHYMAKYDGGAYADILLNGDIHTHNQNAAGLPSRDVAKTFIYGFLYGAGDGKIGKIVGGGVQDGRALRDKFLRSLPALKRVKDEVSFQVSKNGSLSGLDDRPLPIRSDHSALNTLLQSAGAVVMKFALRAAYREAEKLFGPHGKRWALMLNVHDEIQAECELSIADALGQCMVRGIVKAGEELRLNVRLDGEYKVGANWSECH